MYKLTIKEIYHTMTFEFDSFADASEFLEKAMSADKEQKYKFELIKVVE